MTLTKNATIGLILFILLGLIVSGSFALDTSLPYLVEVHNKGKVAYGFIVKSDGYLITTVNILDNPINIKIKTFNGKIYNADILFKDNAVGFGFLKIQERVNLQAAVLGDSSIVNAGDKVVLPATEPQGNLSGIIERIMPNFNNYFFPNFLTNMNIWMENDGKPALGINKRVIGVYSYYNKNKIIIPINAIKQRIYDEKVIKDDFDFTMLDKKQVRPNKKEIDIAYRTEFPKENNYIFGEISGLVFDDKNNVYVLDGINREIHKYSSDFSFVKTNDPQQVDFQKPIDLAYSPSNILYVLDKGEKQIKLLNTNLSLLKTIDFSVFSKEANFEPCRIKVDRDSIFVLSKNTHKIYKLKNNLVSEIGRYGFRKGELDHPSDFLIYENEVVVLDKGNKRVQIYDKKGNFKLNFPVHLETEVRLAKYKDKIICLDKYNNHVKIFDKNGYYLRMWNTQINSRYGSVDFIEFDNYSNGYVVYKNRSFIKVYDNKGFIDKSVANFIDKNKHFYNVKSVNKDGDGNIIILDERNNLFRIKDDELEKLGNISDNRDFDANYICIASTGDNYLSFDSNNNQLVYFNSDLEIVKKVGYFGYDYGEFDKIMEIEVDNGEIYIADKYNKKVLVFDPEGYFKREIPVIVNKQPLEIDSIFIKTIERTVEIEKDLDGMPVDIEKTAENTETEDETDGEAVSDVEKDGDNPVPSEDEELVETKTEIIKTLIVLAENFVCEYDFEGNLLNSFHIKKSEKPFIGLAKSVAAYSDKYIFVADTFNNTVQIFDQNGQFIKNFGSVGSGNEEFNQPRFLYLSENFLYVMDYINNRIMKYEIVIEQEEEIAEDGETGVNPDVESPATETEEARATEISTDADSSS